jgi:hypothetical protein
MFPLHFFVFVHGFASGVSSTFACECVPKVAASQNVRFTDTRSLCFEPTCSTKKR